MASHYLLKTEPSEYSFEDLKRDAETVWDGVHNPVALRNLAAMKAGDKLIVYETADRKSAVGTATVVSADASNPKNPVVKIKAGKPLPNRSLWRRSRAIPSFRIRHWFVRGAFPLSRSLLPNTSS